jgi:type II secretory pathway pseudopilin PulG
MRDRGFVMVALLIGMAVTAVWMATMLPAWRQQAIREKEENLVFYGNQYAKALGHYYLKNNCTLPPDVDALVSGHYLRRKWKDPITGKDFLAQMIGGASSSGGLGQTPVNMGPRGGTGNTGQQQAPIGGNRGAQPAAPAGPAGGAAPGRGNTPAAPGVGQGPVGSGQAQLVGLAGVLSESTATSIRLVNQTQQYNLWRFDYLSGLQMLGRSPGCQNGQPIGTGNQGQQGGARQGDGRGSPANTPGGLNPRGGGPTVPGGVQGGGLQGAGGPPPPGATSGRGRGGN